MARRGVVGVTWTAQRPRDGATEAIVGILGDHMEWDFLMTQGLAMRHEGGDEKPQCEELHEGHLLVRNLRRRWDTALLIHKR